MMNNKIYLIFSTILVLVALLLRLYALPARAPFDWDQNRDYQAIKEIASGKVTLIGPVAKGEGGFFLGPLYYYLSIPAFMIMQGDPVSLPLTSVILDVLAILAILSLLPKVMTRNSSFILAFIWAISFFAIEISKISWNVSLIPLFSILLIYFSSISQRTHLSNLLYGLVLGLSWHVHAALIPLVILLVVSLIFFGQIKLRELPIILLGYLISLTPLILFDLRHNFLNLHLMQNFTKASGVNNPEFTPLLDSVFSRFGKNIYGIIFSKYDLHFWWGIIFFILALFSLVKGALVGKISSTIILINLFLVTSLREIGFAEYYLAICYLLVFIVLLSLLERYSKLYFSFIFLFIPLFSYANLKAFTIIPTGFSLGQKQKIISAIAQKSKSIDLYYDLPFGRDTAFNLLLPRYGVELDKNSKTKVIISEKMSERLYIDGEITDDLGYFGGMHVGIRVVQ